MKSTFKNVWPYQKDPLNLSVAKIEGAIPFYETVMGFQVVSRSEAPVKSAVLERDGIQIGLAENGGDPTQDGCFFEVDNADNAFAELRANGLAQEEPNFTFQSYGPTYKVFFVVAPDGLCYCLGERQ
ncbi:VOC family protein [Runella slithyformis]|uniref:Glyoxalase/bleomycin resistance protein/dioxygenase n=1 Tax=Runella slithyformis (strain ATCC 29530 / DSM 19594 / LMG 11500 / NCIMB 11436 / LSU 4) TaxID=761193 RepID=A0A7U3ZQR8_RUNSL|nr:VOC family protein [Runella slithyformis]AEI51642.1 Glyoxalase/bleomycin resistance protein/dioxygenase [Runella slithyformis DSM 19594]